MTMMKLPSLIGPGHEDFGRHRVMAQKPVAQYELTESLEDAMLRRIEELGVKAQIAKDRVDLKGVNNAQRQETAWREVLGELYEPATAHEIASVTGKSEQAVSHVLRKMEAAGYVTWQSRPRKDGVNQPRIWTATGKKFDPADIVPSTYNARGSETRSRAVNLLSTPKTISTVAAELDMSPDAIRKMFRTLSRQGLIEPRGEVMNSRGLLVTLWVKA